jgi:hypothetical protein
MTFEEMLDQALAILQHRGRVSYRALKLPFSLDDDRLEALTDELLYAHPELRDDAGRGFIWTSATGTAPLTARALTETPEQESLAYTPAYLAEKILTSRSALEGERKQVTGLFADLRGSMALLADRDPEQASGGASTLTAHPPGRQRGGAHADHHKISLRREHGRGSR